MPLQLIRADITAMTCDAIVNPTNTALYPGGGLDAAIHEAAGEELFEACRTLGELAIGEAKVTKGFALPCRYVIHTAGPVWQGGDQGECELLAACYRNTLMLAASLSLESVALPLISSGSHGFPKRKALEIAIHEIGSVLDETELTVYLVLLEKSEYEISRTLYEGVTSFIDDCAAEKRFAAAPRKRRRLPNGLGAAQNFRAAPAKFHCDEEMTANALPKFETLGERLDHLDKGFADTLFEFIDSRKITDVECYKRSNVDKKTFSKIKCNPDYRPSKLTVLSFAIGLRLTVEETNRLLMTVGMTLSHSYRFDVIVEYFLATGEYRNIHDVNTVLFEFDQPVLGALS